jgi:hypothetical protein
VDDRDIAFFPGLLEHANQGVDHPAVETGSEIRLKRGVRVLRAAERVSKHLFLTAV